MIIVCPDCSKPYELPSAQVSALVQVACPHCSHAVILDFEAANNPGLRETGHRMTSGFLSREDYEQSLQTPVAVPAANRDPIESVAQTKAPAAQSGAEFKAPTEPKAASRPSEALKESGKDPAKDKAPAQAPAAKAPVGPSSEQAAKEAAKEASKPQTPRRQKTARLVAPAKPETQRPAPSADAAEQPRRAPKPPPIHPAPPAPPVSRAQGGNAPAAARPPTDPLAQPATFKPPMPAVAARPPGQPLSQAPDKAAPVAAAAAATSTTSSTTTSPTTSPTSPPTRKSIPPTAAAGTSSPRKGLSTSSSFPDLGPGFGDDGAPALPPMGQSERPSTVQIDLNKPSAGNEIYAPASSGQAASEPLNAGSAQSSKQDAQSSSSFGDSSSRGAENSLDSYADQDLDNGKSGSGWIWWIIAALLLAGGGFFGWNAMQAGSPDPTLQGSPQ